MSIDTVLEDYNEVLQIFLPLPVLLTTDASVKRYMLPNLHIQSERLL